MIKYLGNICCCLEDWRRGGGESKKQRNGKGNIFRTKILDYTNMKGGWKVKETKGCESMLNKGFVFSEGRFTYKCRKETLKVEQINKVC